MLFLNFNNWTSKHGRIFSYWRYFRQGEWTPFIKIVFRYLKTEEPCNCHVCRARMRRLNK